LRDDEVPVVFPVEAKAADEVVNRVQIAAAVAYCQTYFAGHEIRPIVVKLTYDGILHFLEFRSTTSLAGLRILNSHGYRLNISPQQLRLIRSTQTMLKEATSQQKPMNHGAEQPTDKPEDKK
jgi:hypothetical protein